MVLPLPLPRPLLQVLVFRMFFRWLAKYYHSDQVHYQAVFVTASKTLKEQVGAPAAAVAALRRTYERPGAPSLLFAGVNILLGSVCAQTGTC